MPMQDYTVSSYSNTAYMDSPTPAVKPKKKRKKKAEPEKPKGFFGTVAHGLSKAAHNVDEYQQKNRKSQFKQMQEDVRFEKLKTAKMKEKEKQKKYQSDNPFRW